MGTQMGKSNGFFNAIGQKLDDDPAPILYIGPTRSLLENVIEPQIETMLRTCPTLAEKRPKTGRRKKLKKDIAGVSLRMAWAGSGTELSAQPAHTVLLDEVDLMEPIPGEGDAITAAEARTATYADHKILITSTPTVGAASSTVHPETGLEHWDVADAEDVDSKVWRYWQEGTRHEWAVPCPFCNEYFIPRFKLLSWSEGSSARRALHEAKLGCARCGSLIDESHKAWMNENGRAVAPGQYVKDGQVCGPEPESETFSLWVSGLMSPWRSFGRCASDWIEASRSHDQDRIQACMNKVFGELYRVRGEAPEASVVQKIAEQSSYRLGDVPKGVQIIFLTADVQKDRIVYVVRGWGAEFESWLIEYGEIWGDTDQVEVYDRLDAITEKIYDGVGVQAYAIDSGFRTELVYDWAHKHVGRAYATKGKERPAKLYSASDVEVRRDGKRIRHGLKVWTLDEGYFKGWVHDRLVRPQDQPGAWHLPRDAGDDYCKQIVNEQRRRLPSGRVQWIKVGSNDYLDCEKQQIFLANVEGVRHLRPIDDKQGSDDLASLARKLNS